MSTLDAVVSTAAADAVTAVVSVSKLAELAKTQRDRLDRIGDILTAAGCFCTAPDDGDRCTACELREALGMTLNPKQDPQSCS